MCIQHGHTNFRILRYLHTMFIVTTFTFAYYDFVFAQASQEESEP